jgi:hypothetical protein
MSSVLDQSGSPVGSQTPLERYIASLLNKTGSTLAVTMDTDHLAIGEDNKFSDLLLQGIQNHFKPGTDHINLPNCLAYHLILTQAKWDDKINLDWLQKALESITPPKTIWVMHVKCVSALTSTTKLDESAFKSAYNGNQKSTYMEVCKVLQFGYTKATKLSNACCTLSK